MIKFFRKIRQQLLTDNKFSKYLIYALGEIILVVIGILIALQINNWNEDNKSQVREKFYLESLLGDMKNNLKEIDGDIASNEKVIQSCDSLLLLANNGNYLSVDDSRLEKLVVSLGNYSKLQLEQGTIEEIISSGALQVIHNEDLRGQLVDWERNLIEIKETEKFARQFQEKYFSILDTFLPYYKFRYVDIKYPEQVREDYFNNIQLLNSIGNIRFIAKRLNVIYEKKIIEIEALILMIENELNK